jgi:anti-sigma B factor antagonist
MQDGRFPVKLVSGVPVLAAPEEIDITNAPELRMALLQAATDGPVRLVADMTRTRFCDSSGLHTLLAAHKRAQTEGGELRLVLPADGAVPRIFAITGIDRMIPSFTGLDEALAQASSNGRLVGGPMTDSRAVHRRQRARRRSTTPAAATGKRTDGRAACLPSPSPGRALPGFGTWQLPSRLLM